MDIVRGYQNTREYFIQQLKSIELIAPTLNLQVVWRSSSEIELSIAVDVGLGCYCLYQLFSVRRPQLHTIIAWDLVSDQDSPFWPYFFFFFLFTEAGFIYYIIHSFYVYNLIIFRNFTNLCHYHYKSVSWHCHHLNKTSRAHLLFVLIPTLSLLQTIINLLFLWICICWTFHINGTTQYVSNFNMHRNHLRILL